MTLLLALACVDPDTATKPDTADTSTETGETGDSGTIDTDTGETSTTEPPPLITGTPWRVCADGTGDFLTPQDAMEGVTEGDTLILCAGEYGPLEMTDTAVSLYGEGGSTVTRFVRDEEHWNGAVVDATLGSVEATQISFSGFTVDAGAKTYGMFVGFDDGVSVALSDIVVENAYENDIQATALRASAGAELLLEHVTVRHTQSANVFDYENGVVELEGSPVTVRHLNVHDVVTEHGPILSTLRSTMTVQNALFWDVFSDQGTMIYALDGTVENTTFSGSSARADSVVYVSVARNCIFQGNTSSIPLGSPELEMEDEGYNLFYDNTYLAGEEILSETDVAADARFTDAANGDLTLLPDSPAIDAGDPDPAYNDPDGTRNDIGAFGGPHGAW